jgi:hypothetical protein
MAFQNAMEMASDDGQDGDAQCSTLLTAHDVRGLFLTLEAFTNEFQDQDNALRLDDSDNEQFEVAEDDDDETGDYEDTTVGKKRKRVRIEVPEIDLNHSKVTNARIKTGGGESFLLDDETNMLGHHKSSRVFGTFGRRKIERPLW